MAGAKVLLSEGFDGCSGEDLPAGWWAEGGERVWIQDGRLWVRANALDDIAPDRGNVGGFVCTVWCGTEVGGDLRVEFDAHVVASAPGVNNVNLFCLYSDPSGQPLYDTRAERAGADYPLYHPLDGYIVTFLQDPAATPRADGTRPARFRLRRCPGFALLQETHGYHCQQDRTYRVCFERRGRRLTYAVDGTVYLSADDRAPHDRGLIGLRTFRTELWFDNLEVTALE